MEISCPVCGVVMCFDANEKRNIVRVEARGSAHEVLAVTVTYTTRHYVGGVTCRRS